MARGAELPEISGRIILRSFTNPNLPRVLLNLTIFEITLSYQSNANPYHQISSSSSEALSTVLSCSYHHPIKTRVPDLASKLRRPRKEEEMAISSISSSAIPSLTTPRSFYSSKLSSFSSLLPPAQLRRFQLRNVGLYSHSSSRILPLVAAKQQTFSNLDELLGNSDKPILVDFYATWCGPCQFMTPILNEVSAVLKDTVQLVKIDTEKYPNIADKYQIGALPTFILFKDGKPCDRFEGALTKDQLIQRIESSLNVKL